MKDGFLTHSFDCGGSPVTITSKETFNDGQWHNVSRSLRPLCAESCQPQWEMPAATRWCSLAKAHTCKENMWQCLWCHGSVVLECDHIRFPLGVCTPEVQVCHVLPPSFSDPHFTQRFQFARNSGYFQFQTAGPQCRFLHWCSLQAFFPQDLLPSLDFAVVGPDMAGAEAWTSFCWWTETGPGALRRQHQNHQCEPSLLRRWHRRSRGSDGYRQPGCKWLDDFAGIIHCVVAPVSHKHAQQRQLPCNTRATLL